MTPLQERLSELWSEELSEADARALRAQIATEPEVAVEWERLCAAMDALHDLPDLLPPPPLRATAAVRPASRTWRSAAPWVLAAAAALLWVLPAGSPELVLVDGAQWVEGEVRLVAGDVPIEVDGKVWISVEPADGVMRVGVPDVEDPMNKSTLIAGLAGAIVTVVVYEGTAVVRAASDVDGVVVSAGETHHVDGPVAPKGAPLSPQERQANITRLQGELAEVQQALAEAQFEGALTRGQLAALQGTPSAWPADVPPEIGPERFRTELEARIADLPGVEIAEVDCAEYPCVAALQYTGVVTDDDWNKPLGNAVRGWLEGAMGDGISLSVNTSRFSDDDHEERYVIFGAHQEGRDSEVGARTEFRIDAMVDELGERMHDPAE